MVEILNVKVYDLKESVIASGLAMRTTPCEYTEEEFKKGLKRAVKLSKCGGGSGHTSFRKGIIVNFDLKYTQYITKQLQRYHWFEYISSSSLMHRLVAMDVDKSCNKYVSKCNITDLQKHIDIYNDIVKNQTSYMKFEPLRDGEIIECNTYKECLYTSYMLCISNCPMGFELIVRVSTNYEQLATIYKQRKNHKLKEDYGAICDFIEGLPYSKELILCSKSCDVKDENKFIE